MTGTIIVLSGLAIYLFFKFSVIQEYIVLKTCKARIGFIELHKTSKKVNEFKKFVRAMSLVSVADVHYSKDQIISDCIDGKDVINTSNILKVAKKANIDFSYEEADKATIMGINLKNEIANAKDPTQRLREIKLKVSSFNY
jgi:uncharacterized protein YqfA (UPF0365 family)